MLIKTCILPVSEVFIITLFRKNFCVILIIFFINAENTKSFANSEHIVFSFSKLLKNSYDRFLISPGLNYQNLRV